MSLTTRPSTLFEQIRDCGIFYARTCWWLVPWGFLFYAVNFSLAFFEGLTPALHYGLYNALLSVLLLVLSFIMYVFFHGIFIHQTWLMIQEQPHPLRESIRVTGDRFFNLAAGFALLLVLFFVLPSLALYFLLSDLLLMNQILAGTLLLVLGLYIALVTTFLVAYIPIILLNRVGCLRAIKQSIRQVHGQGWRVFGVLFILFWIPFIVIRLLHLQVVTVESLWLDLIVKGVLFSLFTSLNFIMVVIIWQNLAAVAIKAKTEA